MNILQALKDRIMTIHVKYLNNEDIEILPIHYIGGSQTLPPPLEPEEEEKLLNRLTNKDIEARQTVVERNLRLVVYIAKKFENTGVGIEDLVSIGTIRPNESN
jgi:RNA polymerase sporulation-specific sigma factor